MSKRITLTEEHKQEAEQVLYAITHGETYKSLAEKYKKSADYYYTLMRTYKPILGITDTPITFFTWAMYSGELDNIVSLYEKEKTNMIQIGRKYGVSERTIARCLAKAGVATRPAGFASRTNQTLFDNINNELACYIIGLLTADGSVSSKGYSITLTLTYNDAYLLEQINERFLSNSGCLGFSHKEDGEKARAYLRFHGKALCKQLSKYGIVPNKTYSLSSLSPLIPKAYYHHYIRGLFDGDGVCSNSNSGIRVGYCAYRKEMVQSYQDWIVQVCRANKNKLFNTGNCWQVSWSSKQDLESFYNYIYHDASIYLIRKKTKIETYIHANPEVIV